LASAYQPPSTAPSPSRTARWSSSDFDAFNVLRIDEMPVVEVHIAPSRENPTGVGEPGVPPVVPTVANALFAANFHRIVELPSVVGDKQNAFGDGVALDRRRHDGGSQSLPSIEKPTSTCPFSELHLKLINPSTLPNELNTTLTPHSMIHGDACFAYFNKIWGIPSQLVAAVKTARLTKLRPIETPFGSYPEVTVARIVDIVADILTQVRYLDVEVTFDALCELFPGSQSDEERQHLIGVAERLSQHNLDVWKQAGPYVQTVLVQKIRKMVQSEVAALRPVLLKVLKEVLKQRSTEYRVPTEL
jgi:hypothetical protein